MAIVGAVCGGVFLLIVLIAVVASSGGDSSGGAVVDDGPLDRKVPEARHALELGAVMFICANAPNHEDKEVVINACPGCGAGSNFYREGNTYICRKCGVSVSQSNLKCPTCGRKPTRPPRLKHR